MRVLTILSFLLLTFSFVKATPPDLSEKSLVNPPRRIIRACCSFGSDLKLWIIPGIKLTEITCVQNIGPHKYLGNHEEGNGIIYTRKGGFLDLGHLRDQADWTAYLYSQIQQSKMNGEINLLLGREGGPKSLKLHVPADFSNADAILLAGRIAYDLSIWHEIATWFGASSVPFISERFSSFSIEDPYSNLMGATLGMKAVKSDLSYEQAMTTLLKETLDSLEVVPTFEDTYQAMEKVRNIWWTRNKPLPNWKVLIERQLNVYSTQVPWLIPDDNETPFDLQVPAKTQDGRSLDHFYELDFKLNNKFPVKEMFTTRKKRRINQGDFGILLTEIARQLDASGYPYR